MDSEFKFWIYVIAICCIPILGFSGCTAHSNMVIAEMVKNGADPMEAYCAIGLNRETACQILISKHE